MRVYLQPPQPSRGLDRIAMALSRYAPANIEVTDLPHEADLIVIYAIGRRDAVERQCWDITRRGKQYAVIQVCLKSTMSPSVDNWVDIWENAKVVWSYYDLACEFDRAGYDADGGWKFPQRFYHAPLGVDAGVFYPRPLEPVGLKDFTILTSGESKLSESVRECWLAATTVGGITAHIGATGRMTACTSNYLNQTDEQLAWIYSQCHFVSALRRKEGFELPAAEGLMCGARPICFDSADYRWCYKDFAEYIHEGTRQEVVDQLVELFKRGARPVTEDERRRAAAWFNWETIIGGFWERCL
jgi:hypothetical protein